ncbi:hypothetical protein TraAM80_01033 [Trypanosoma rangeli]|uniref:Uncharacterized protein n=1 Tax=Trypanosoma rangeli TaxID=5698 RepID=A0A422P0N9_TRYRA|nr:uncharacterized protein TraAM80_01033 [Trypanosoma rangeli]RNF11245.1 hypothetical protein TraAM80_01033 [Trypanosoma rangeli]|eukprot:RNF11245.1 hypothetical protein TraAM80_01033 [Trypanosoma rangeli]
MSNTNVVISKQTTLEMVNGPFLVLASTGYAHQTEEKTQTDGTLNHEEKQGVSCGGLVQYYEAGDWCAICDPFFRAIGGHLLQMRLPAGHASRGQSDWSKLTPQRGIWVRCDCSVVGSFRKDISRTGTCRHGFSFHGRYL